MPSNGRPAIFGKSSEAVDAPCTLLPFRKDPVNAQGLYSSIYTSSQILLWPFSHSHTQAVIHCRS